MKRLKFLYVLVPLIALVMTACGLLGTPDRNAPPRGAVVVDVWANTSLNTWLESAIREFNASDDLNRSSTQTAAEKPVFVRLVPVEAGQAVIDLAAGEPEPAIWIPDDLVWVDVLADNGRPGFQDDCVSVAQSPLVIAMWRPVAESLGWPGRPLGWLDVGSLAADPSAWAYYSGGQFGDSLRLGHTHPGLSGTGASTLLAIVQAAQSKTEAVSVTDIEQPIVQASVGAFEGAVSWFSSSTYALGQTMRDRGLSFLGAAVMYENLVIEHGADDPNIIPIYPLEGTFMAAHPACVNKAAGLESQEAALIFRNYLIGEAAQRLALANGLRPVSAQVGLGSPLDEDHGTDVNQPQVIFDPPTLDTIYAVQGLWQSARKPVNMVMLLDTSGSMKGDKLENLKSAAIQFIKFMGDEDYITLIRFSSTPVILIEHVQVGDSRDTVIQMIAGLRAEGNTTLYDAIGDGADVIARTTSSRTTNALVVLTDGRDTASDRYRLNAKLIEAAAANDTTVFAIAYGKDADDEALSDLALRANGNFYLGDEASIASIYEEMSAAFGGSVGIGR
ncbi:MAG: VWA domain-containing protein [Anaerolineales bacterium]